MTAITYISFLGTGNYRPVRYRWGDDEAEMTPYAQQAELQVLLDRRAVDPANLHVLIFGTPTSKTAHWEKQRGYHPPTKAFGESQGDGLGPRLQTMGVQPTFVEISEALDADTQWRTFQELLDRVEPNTRLILDITHGFRAVPVVFSSALHFLTLTRGLRLQHVLYGAHDTDPPAIMDYVRFYAIQDWTDGVSRLIDDADAGKLGALSRAGTSLELKGFEGAELTEALVSITDAVKNVEVHGIGKKVRAALELVSGNVEAARAEGDIASQILLELVEEKFAGLMAVPPLSGRYDGPYYKLQLTFIELLLEHRLFMQAFTAMREYIGSIGMYGHPDEKLVFTNRKGRDRRTYAEVFVSMVSFPRDDWKFHGDRAKQVDKLRPHYERLAEAGLIDELRRFTTELTAIRNGFDHAWTSKAHVPEDIAEQGVRFLGLLRQITEGMLVL